MTFPCLRIDADSPPSRVVSTGIARIQLELVHRIVPREEERDAERTQTSILSVSLLHITDTLDKLFDWHILVVLG